MRLVREFLERTADRLPDKTALVCGASRWSYAEIDRQADRLARALTEAGLKRGERVVIWLPNGVEAVVSIFAVLKAGGVFVMVNRTTKPDKLRYILRNCRASVVVADHRAPAAVLGTRPDDGAGWFRGWVVCGEGAAEGSGPVRRWHEIQADPPADRPVVRNIDLDLACLIYTSGTTGEPKGVMSDHSNVVFASGSIIEFLGNTEEDVVLNLLPLSFDYGLYQLLMTFRFGGTLVLENSFAYPAVALQLIERERVTGLPGVPTVFAMLRHLDLGAYDLSSLRYLTNTAAALPPSHVLDLQARFPQARLYSMYGLTETKRTLYLPPEWVGRKPGSVGVAIPGTEVWIEEDGRRLGPGGVGELMVRGRHVMRGYWEEPEMTARRFRAGEVPGERVCATGDLFRMDEEGFFYFVGRQDDIIKSRGEKVAPKEVEGVLHALPGVVEAAVTGSEDPVMGQTIIAWVVRAGAALTEREVLAHCRAHLEDFMVPQRVEFREALPKSASGKVRKEELV